MLVFLGTSVETETMFFLWIEKQRKVNGCRNSPEGGALVPCSGQL